MNISNVIYCTAQTVDICCGWLCQRSMKLKPLTESRLKSEEKIMFWWEQFSTRQYPIFSLVGKNIFYPFSYAVSSLFNKILNQTLNGNHGIPAKPHHQSRISMGGGSAGSGLLFLPPSVQLPETSSHSQLLFPARPLWFSCCSSKLFKCFQSPTLIHGPKHIFSFLLFQTKQFAFLIKKRQLYL